MELQLAAEQKQNLSQRMIQSANILQMSTQELEEYIKQQELENPLIELEEVPSETRASSDIMRRLEWLNEADERNRVYYRDEYEEEESRESWNISSGEGDTLAEYVLAQLIPQIHNRKDEKILYYLAHSLNSGGYLEEDTASIGKRFGISSEEILYYISLLQSVDPPGIGAASLAECLLLQLNRKKQNPDTTLAKKIVLTQLETLGKNQLDRIARNLQVPLSEVKKACILIQSLNPKPGSGFPDRHNLKYIQPDVTVIKFQDYFQVIVNDASLPKITVSNYYSGLLKEDTSEETKAYIKTKLNQAEWVIRCIGQRSDTLLAVTRMIVELQKPFFEKGLGYRKPLRLIDIAEKLGIHESTVSRAAREKYLQCTWGLFPMSYFFSRAVGGEQDRTSAKNTPEQIKEKLRRLIEAEDKKKPLSDQKLSLQLADSGMEISRRTVAKYRTEMEIPDASGRKLFQ